MMAQPFCFATDGSVALAPSPANGTSDPMIVNGTAVAAVDSGQRGSASLVGSSDRHEREENPTTLHIPIPSSGKETASSPRGRTDKTALPCPVESRPGVHLVPFHRQHAIQVFADLSEGKSAPGRLLQKLTTVSAIPSGAPHQFITTQVCLAGPLCLLSGKYAVAVSPADGSYHATVLGRNKCCIVPWGSLENQPPPHHSGQ